MGGMVTMFAPDGTQGQIPQANVQAAVAAGGKLGVPVYAPDGTPGYVPQDKLGDAIHAGGTTEKPAPLTANPNGEGTYQMTGPNGTVAVPYSKVPGAKASGYAVTDADQARYQKDANPGALYRGVTALAKTFGLPTSEPEAQAAEDASNPLKHPVKTLIEAAGGPAVQVAEGAYQGAKRSAGEIKQAYQAGKEGNTAGVAQHLISAIPIVGSGLDTAADQYADGNYAGEAGTLLGTLAQVAPLAEGVPGVGSAAEAGEAGLRRAASVVTKPSIDEVMTNVMQRAADETYSNAIAKGASTEEALAQAAKVQRPALNPREMYVEKQVQRANGTNLMFEDEPLGQQTPAEQHAAAIEKYQSTLKDVTEKAVQDAAARPGAVPQAADAPEAPTQSGPDFTTPAPAVSAVAPHPAELEGIAQTMGGPQQDVAATTRSAAEAIKQRADFRSDTEPDQSAPPTAPATSQPATEPATGTPPAAEPTPAAPPPPKPIDYQAPDAMRDVVASGARAVKGISSADYGVLDSASEGRWQRFDDRVRNLQDAMGNDIDDEAYDKHATERDRIEAQRDTMVQNLVQQGKITPELAGRAVENYKRAMALNDVDRLLKPAMTRVKPEIGGAFEDQIDPAKAAPRLRKLNDIPINGGPSRLEQAFGPEGASRMMKANDDALTEIAAKDLPGTARQAFKKVIDSSTKSDPSFLNRNAQRTDWSKALDKFDGMDDTERDKFGNDDLIKSRAFLQRQARWQKTAEFIKQGAKYGGPVGITDYVLHRMFDSSNDNNR